MKILIAFTFLSALASAQVTVPPTGPASLSTNAVVQWNRNLLAVLRTPGAQPNNIHPTRSFAIMHAAIYDAVNAIDQTHHAYLVQVPGASRDASPEAAASAAAYEVLIALYPKFQATLLSELDQSLALVPEGAAKDDGMRIGVAAADQILAFRSNDGTGTQPGPVTVTSGNAPGGYESTPPNFPKAQFTLWSQVTPFALQQASQFRPGPPPALTSQAYRDDFNEIQSAGRVHSVTATVDQALTGRFWNGPIQNYWNEIAQTAALSNDLTTAQSARLFALLNLTLADGVIAFYDAKYTYNFWRPVTAIRAADLDGNPDTVADPNWLPEVGNTPADPSYPGAHAVISAAAALVLQSYFGSDQLHFNVTSEVLAGVQRSFNTFSSAADEAALSRIYAGVHFRTDLTTGQQLGTSVATWVVDNVLTPVIP
ncbi:MAG: vanadium-dependent haloperoxidase [Acidobacteriaceae bacterium]|nr:vanadium-dependent haloperoxidase [Acidobacteriaceae bacterium]